MYITAHRIHRPLVGDGMPRGPPKAQFNIRMSKELLDRYREYCERHGLDPHGQIVIFMKRVVDAEYDFQDKLWDALRAESPVAH